MLRDGPAHGDVLPVDGEGGLPHGGPGLLDGGAALRRRQDAVQHVLEVHGGGAGGIEIVPVRPAAGQEVRHGLQPGAQGQDVEGVAGEDADGRRSPDPQRGDGFKELLWFGQLQPDRLAGQQALVQDADRSAVLGQRDVFGDGDGSGCHRQFPSFFLLFFMLFNIVTGNFGKRNEEAAEKRLWKRNERITKLKKRNGQNDEEQNDQKSRRFLL